MSPWCPAPEEQGGHQGVVSGRAPSRPAQDCADSCGWEGAAGPEAASREDAQRSSGPLLRAGRGAPATGRQARVAGAEGARSFLGASCCLPSGARCTAAVGF